MAETTLSDCWSEDHGGPEVAEPWDEREALDPPPTPGPPIAPPFRVSPNSLAAISEAEIVDRVFDYFGVCRDQLPDITRYELFDPWEIQFHVD